MKYTYSIHQTYMKYTALCRFEVHFMYTFCIHFFFPFCTSNLEHPEVYKKYTSPRGCLPIVYMFYTQKDHKKYTFCIHLQNVYFLQDGGCPYSYRYKSIHFVYMDAETQKIPGKGMHDHHGSI